MSEEARESAFIRELSAFLTAIEADEAAVYDAPSWRQRGEKYGNGAFWTIIVDGGPLWFALNPGSAVDDAWAERIEGIFRRFLDRHGFWYELGYSWTFHLYKAEDA